MRNLRTFFFLFLLVAIASTAIAQPKPIRKNTKTTKKTVFSGKLIQKPWSKSIESYCAQGSEYYVLQMGDGTEIVVRNDSQQDLAAFNGKNVNITGQKETKTIKSNNNPMEQRPISQQPMGGDENADFTCTVLVIQKIELKK